MGILAVGYEAGDGRRKAETGDRRRVLETGGGYWRMIEATIDGI